MLNQVEHNGMSGGIMKLAVEPRSQEELLWAALDPILYGDIFDYPLTFEEIFHYCPCTINDATLKQFVESDAAFRKIIDRKEQFFFLRGREHIVDLRLKRQVHSQRHLKTVKKVGRFLAVIPFVRAVLITGSLSVLNAGVDDDLDFLVITSPRRLWIVFGILGTIQRIVSRRILCPNYYLSIDYLELERKCRYVAREALQSQTLFGEPIIRKFYASNAWMNAYFPNHYRNGKNREMVESNTSGFISSRLKHILEMMLSGTVGEKLEALLKGVLSSRLKIHYHSNGRPVPPKVWENAIQERELRFHGLGHEHDIMAAFVARRQRAEALLKSLA